MKPVDHAVAVASLVETTPISMLLEHSLSYLRR